MGKKKRLHILGGGMSSLVTAFAITDIKDWRETYESITVYQHGWRLGGKGASGRNAEYGDRIEEHGLHVLFGCYENTFRLMRECYAELDNHWPWPFAPWKFEDAFKGDPEKTTVCMFEKIGPSWLPWLVEAPTRDDQPGLGEPLEFDARGVLRWLLGWARYNAGIWRDQLAAQPEGLLKSLLAKAESLVEVPLHLLDAAVAELDLMGGEEKAGLAAGLGAIPENVFEKAIEAFEAWAERGEVLDDKMRRARIVVDLALTIVKGLIRDRVLWPEIDWFTIDDYDLRDWLARHGAREETRQSALVQGLYDAIFSWNAPVGAGTILQALVRAMFYKGAVLYRMQAGMGDTIFAPLYHVLRNRGVRFEFFHRVEDIELSADRTRIATIRFDRQVQLVNDEYSPLVAVKDLPCWPSKPIASEIAAGQDIKNHDLEDWWDPWRGKPARLDLAEEDLVVLGISVGAFPYICRSLMKNPLQPRFEEMVMSVATCQTQAAQLWLGASLQGLGWKHGLPIVIPYEEPFDTWADMTHLQVKENVPGTVHHIAYLCSSLDDQEPLPPRSDHEYPKRQRQRVFENVQRWLDRSAGGLWPKAVDAGGKFNQKLLQKWKAQGPGELLADQHWCAVVNPSDRYVRAIPGSNAKRLRADESGYPNLYLTGDWTKNALSVGCLESATMAGLQTARAIDSRVPKAVYDWLPDTSPVAPAALAAPAKPKSLYVRRDGELLTVPPVGLGVDMRAFVLRADMGKLTELCRDHLNLGPGADYRPAGPFVVLYASDLDHIIPAGTIGGSEFGIWVPVIARADGGKDRRLLTYTPYLWVDSSAALIGGRAVYGFPKHMGRLSMPRTSGQAFELSVDAEVVHLPQGKAEWRRLFTVKPTDGSPWQEPTTAWSAAEILELVKLMLEVVDEIDSPTIELLAQLMRPGDGMPMVFLKEYPDVDASWRACYQAVIETPIEIMGSAKSGRIPGRFEVAFERHWSHNIVSELGLQTVNQPQTSGDVVPVLAAGYMRFKSRVAGGKIIWQA